MTEINSLSLLPNAVEMSSLFLIELPQKIFTDWNGRTVMILDALKWLQDQVIAAVNSIFSSCYYLFQLAVHCNALPTNRIDETFEALPYLNTGRFNDLIQTVVLYEEDYSKDIVESLLQGNEISNAVRSIAESVTVLDLNSCAGSAEMLDQILQLFKNVEVLTMPESMRGEDLKAVLHLKNLRELNLSNCNNIEDADLRVIENMTELQLLKLFSCRKITDVGIAYLANLISLKYLSLNMCLEVTDNALKSLENLKCLKHLDLSCCTNVTDVGIGCLVKNFPNLEFLDLYECTKISSDGYALLAKLTSLKSLNLSWAYIEDTDLTFLESLVNLTYLNLNMCHVITDLGLNSLTNLNALETLSLCHCHNITAACLSSLAKLTSLTLLKLNGCRDISEAHVNEAKKNNPKLKIEF